MSRASRTQPPSNDAETYPEKDERDDSAMTYCVGIMLDTGLIFASDSRTHAEVDNFARFCKMTTFERAGDRVIVLLSSGGLAGTQAVI